MSWCSICQTETEMWASVMRYETTATIGCSRCGSEWIVHVEAEPLEIGEPEEDE